MKNNHIEELINTHQRRLQVLQKQKAAMGILTPAHIITEIEDIQQEMSSLVSDLQDQDQLNAQSPKPNKHSANSEIFISYAWDGESEKLVDLIDQAAQKKGITIIRDKRDATYKADIKKFMQRIGRAKAIIVVISKRYLESKNCMFELVEIAKNGQLYDCIYPIILEDANIYEPVKRADYIIYWDNKIQELDSKLKKIESSANLTHLQQAVTQYTKFRETIDKLTYILQNMNTLTSEIHQNSGFETLFQAIERKILT